MAVAVPTATEAREVLAGLADPERIDGMARFFKTGPGQYGAGDVFIGIPMPALRLAAKGFAGIAADQIDVLLDSEIHEHRMFGLLLMRREFEKTGPRSDRAQQWVRRYCAAVDRGRVNNWDLVDASAYYILGAWCLRCADSAPLVAYAEHEALFARRVGVVGTFAWLRAGDPSATLAIAPVVLADRRDLIQKAFGWMLREMGKRVSPELLIDFLDAHAAAMGRTALSYATEQLSAQRRADYRAR